MIYDFEKEAEKLHEACQKQKRKRLTVKPGIVRIYIDTKGLTEKKKERIREKVMEYSIEAAAAMYGLPVLTVAAIFQGEI